MRVDLLSISNFYNNPDQMREFILTQPFDAIGNYPGKRTKSFIDDNIKNTIQEFIRPFAGNVTWWGDEASGAFQYTTVSDRSWLHVDGTDWAGVCYLTPDAPLSSGTGLYRRKTNDPIEDHFSEFYDLTKWDLVDRIGNVYNRLILYRGDLYHCSLDYFGKDLQTGRIFQTFFFNTER